MSTRLPVPNFLLPTKYYGSIGIGTPAQSLTIDFDSERHP